MRIRKARLRDLPEIYKLCAKLIKKEFNEYDRFINLDWVYERSGKNFFNSCFTNPKSYVIIAFDEEDNSIVGYLVGKIIKGEEYRKLPKTGEISSLYLMEKYRNKGIGTKMSDEIIKWFKLKGVKLLRVETSSGNLSGINFYKKQGFRDYSIILEKEI